MQKQPLSVRKSRSVSHKPNPKDHVQLMSTKDSEQNGLVNALNESEQVGQTTSYRRGSGAV
ncbi:MAG: hypothetical protein K2Q26_15535 [Bdellovibrionales bacterium]|nr:hypothetical protein [Bdellovibrionales bacterium]